MEGLRCLQDIFSFQGRLDRKHNVTVEQASETKVHRKFIAIHGKHICIEAHRYIVGNPL